MISQQELERILRTSWKDAQHLVPEPDSRGEHYGVAVWGVIDDPVLARTVNEKRVVDVVVWWPASRVWTVTFAARGDQEARDYPCKVTHWQHLPPLPW